MIAHDLRKLQSFHTSCPRKILHIFWPKKISNNELFKLTDQEDMRIIITRRRWSWVGHVLRRESTSISKVALRRVKEGKRKRGRPKSTCRRTAEAELQDLNLTWGQASLLAKDRQQWRRLVDALCATRRLKDWWRGSRGRPDPLKDRKRHGAGDKDDTLGSLHRENGTTFSGILFIPENFLWNEQKSRVHFHPNRKRPLFL